MAFAETQELAVRLTLKDELSRGLKSASRGLSGFNKATSNTQKALGNTTQNISRLATVGLAATTAGFVGVVKAAADYESAFAGVRKTVEATEPQLEQLSDAIRQMSREIPISAAELARLGEAGGALGIATADLEDFIRVTALLGETTDLTADEAATSLGTLSNVLKLTGDEYDNFASTLVALGNAGASTESQIIQLAERMGAAGELIGLSTEQVLGFASAAASLGIEAEAGGSSFQKFFIDSTKAVADGGKELETYAKIAGQTASEFAKAFDQDAGGALQRFLKGLGELDQASQLQALADLGFNDVRITRLLLGLANNTGLVTDQLNIANDAFAKNSALTKEAGERFKTFDSQMQLAKNSLTDIGITIGSRLLPKLVPLIQRFNEFINQNQGKIEAFADEIAAGFGKFADEVQRTDFTPLIDGLRTSFTIAKQAIDVFNGLPDPIKKLLIAGAAVNKVTGGLVTGLGKDILGSIGQQFLSRGSSPANPLWVTMAGSGPGIDVDGGKAGGGKGWLRTLGTAFAAVAAPVLITEIRKEVAPLPTDKVFGNTEGAKPFWELIGKPGMPFGPPIRPAGDIAKDIGNIPVFKQLTTAVNRLAPIVANAAKAPMTAEQAKAADKTTSYMTNAGTGGFTASQFEGAMQRGVERGFSPTRRDVIATLERTQARSEARQAINNATLVAQHASDRATYLTAASTVTSKLSTEHASDRASYMTAATGISSTLSTQHANDRSSYMTAASGISSKVTAAGSATASAARAAGEKAAAGARAGGEKAAGAIRAKKWQFTNNVTVPVSLRTGGTYINGRLFAAGVNRESVFARVGQARVAS